MSHAAYTLITPTHTSAATTAPVRLVAWSWWANSTSDVHQSIFGKCLRDGRTWPCPAVRRWCA